MTRRLVLLRHGETDHNRTGRAQGQLDVPLNDRGLAQARAVAPVVASLQPAFIRSSDLVRATATAAIVAEACGGVPVRTDARFRELAVGTHRQDRTWPEYCAEHPDEAEALLTGRVADVPGRESVDDVRDRYAPALAEALADVPAGGCGVVVGHGASIRWAVADLLGLGEAWQSLSALGNCGWAELVETRPTFREFGDGLAWRLGSWNRTAPPS